MGRAGLASFPHTRKPGDDDRTVLEQIRELSPVLDCLDLTKAKRGGKEEVVRDVLLVPAAIGRALVVLDLDDVEARRCFIDNSRGSAIALTVRRRHETRKGLLLLLVIASRLP